MTVQRTTEEIDAFNIGYQAGLVAANGVVVNEMASDALSGDPLNSALLVASEKIIAILKDTLT